MMTAMAQFPSPGESFGPYRVTRELGRGGMGAVFAAIQPSLGREVALKVLLPQFAADPHFRDRFVREATVLARLDSPHIVQVYDHGEYDGCLFISTQLIDGGDLSGFLARSGPLDPATAVDITTQVVDALENAHRAGVIHRDVKSKNVLVRSNPGTTPYVYLCDFGIAHLSGHELTVTGSVMGSYATMAPERFRGEPASVQADIYAVGCLLWHMLTGGPPYKGTELELPLQHLSHPIPVLEGDGPVVQGLNVLLQGTLAKDAAHRYQSAAELRNALAALRPALLAGDQPTLRRQAPPVPATQLRPPPAQPPDRTTPDRGGTGGWIAAAIAALLLVALVTGGGVYLLTRGGDDHASAGATKAASTTGTPTPGAGTASATANAPVGATTPFVVSSAGTPAVMKGGSEGGAPVLVLVGQRSGTPTLMMVDASAGGLGRVLAEQAMPTGAALNTISVGDFDGDGDSDVAWAQQRSGGGVDWWIARGNGQGLSAPTRAGFQKFWIAADMKVMVGDFNGDGVDDLAELGQPDGGGVDVWVVPADGNGGFGAAYQALPKQQLSWRNVQVVSGEFTTGDGAGVATVDPVEGGVEFRIFPYAAGKLGAAQVWWRQADWKLSEMFVFSGNFSGDSHDDVAEMGVSARGGLDIRTFSSTGSGFREVTGLSWGDDPVNLAYQNSDLSPDDTAVAVVPGEGGGDGVVLLTWADGAAHLRLLTSNGSSQLSEAKQATMASVYRG